ncbi:ribonuclease J [Dietzia timorensis]|uniref:Ribonuclease J n=1 Tax=Dietzia timorensis TaxID=499555 RepID=A0A173LLP8_9ACTN|nr:ribonuclease J [Dietzia timorensis]ANI92579.1 Ribonuclease J [Dietzia timorensis]
MTESQNRNRGRSRVKRNAGPPSENREPQNTNAAGAQNNAPKNAPTFTEPQAPAASTKDSGNQGSNKSDKSGGDKGNRGNNNSNNSGNGNNGNNGNNGGSGRNGGNRNSGRGGKNNSGRGGNRNSGGRGRGGNNDTATAQHGGMKSMQGGDMTATLPRPSKPKKGALRIVALGGISEIGRNMTVFEYNRKLLIVDCGVLFPSSDEPGVDLILPDFSMLEDRLDDIEALVLTHGHEDHIGAIPFLLKLRPDIPVIGSRFTLALVEAKCREHRIRPNVEVVNESSKTNRGAFNVEYFAVNHSIPDALGIVIQVGGNRIIHTGDIKLDQLPMDKRPTDLPAMARYGDKGVDLLLMDSTNATTPGVSESESGITKSMERVIRGARKQVVVACFASNVYRVQQIIDAAAQAGRKVALNGRSMVRNMEIAMDLGFLNAPDNVIVDMDHAAKLPPEKLVVVTTGTQGEAMAGLSRMARREHRQVNLNSGDTVVFSSSLVPGNEEAVFGVMNRLSQMGVEVITSREANVHVSGHGYAGELLFIYNAVRPRNVMPVHGEWRHLRANKDLAIKTGVPEANTVLAQNGVVVELLDRKVSVVGQIPVGNLYVDGLTTGDIGDTVLADRTVLGEGGFIAATVVVDPRNGRPVSRPQLVGKGFTDDPGALSPAVELVENALLDLAGEGENDPYRMAQVVRRVIGKWVSDKWRRKPMIVPTVITSAVPAE